MAAQIVSDLKTLRTLAEYLLILDPVTFLGYLENLRAAESINSIWLFHDAAHTIFEQVCFPIAPPPGHQNQALRAEILLFDGSSAAARSSSLLLVPSSVRCAPAWTCIKASRQLKPQ